MNASCTHDSVSVGWGRHRGLWAALLIALGQVGCSTAPTSSLALGDPCFPVVAPGDTNPQCASGLCVALDSASGFCTQTCVDDTQCPEAFFCEAAGRYGKVCRKSTGCKEATDCPSGHTCDTETGNCYIKVARMLCSPCQDTLQCPAGGACFEAIGSGEQFCTTACGANDTCPAGFGCQDIPAGPNKALIKQCVPLTQSCNFGKTLCEPCQGDAECGGAHDVCVRNVVSGETFCGRDCNPEKNLCPTPGCVPEELDSAANPECPTGFSCTNIGKTDDPFVRGTYQCVPVSNTCQGYCDGTDDASQLRQCGIGKACKNNQCVGASDGRECAPCFDNDDCRKGSHPENRCIANNCTDCAFKGEAFCATPCADDAACLRTFGPGFVCNSVADISGAMKKYCIPQRGTCQSGVRRLGEDCSVNGAQDCVAGVCLKAGQASLCSHPCKADADCGDTRFRCCESSANGYDCAEEKRTANGPKNGMGVCAPFGGLFGDDCTPGRPPCQTGTCLDLGTARVCTSSCNAGQPCPTGFACRTAKLASGDDTSVCFPEGGGGAGADCSFGPAACAQGLCIRKDSGPICTMPCQDSGDCPVDWACDLVKAVTDQSVQACIPNSLR